MDEGYSSAEIAKLFGLPYVVIRKVRPYDTATLNYNWQVWNTQAFSVYTTTTSRIDRNGAGKAVLSVLNFCSQMGIVKYNAPEVIASTVLYDTDMISVRTAKSGIFEPLVRAGEKVEAGQPVADIIQPYEGEIMETLYAPVDSKIFFIHDEPLTYANSAVIKVVKEPFGVK